MLARYLTAVLLAVLIGCGKKSASNPAPSAPVANSETPTAAVDEAQIAAVLGELTQAVRRYGAEQRRVPKNFDEVVAGGYLSRVPQAPAGKRFAIDKNLQVYLANQ